MIILKILLALLIYLGIPSILLVLFPALSALAATGIGGLISLPILYLLYLRDGRHRRQAVRLPYLSETVIGLLIALGWAACTGLNGLIGLTRLDALFPAFQAQFAGELYSPPLYQQLLFMVLIIPAVEELVFRGHIFGLMRDHFSFRACALTSAFLFGLMHMNVTQGLYAFILGLIMAWLYEKIHGLAAACLFHMAANLFSVLASNFWPDGGFLASLPVSLALTGAGLGVMALCLWQLKKLAAPRDSWIFNLF